MASESGRRGDESSMVYCARCGVATVRAEAIQRRFHAGFSACCNENLLEHPPRLTAAPQVYTGNAPGRPIT